MFVKILELAVALARLCNSVNHVSTQALYIHDRSSATIHTFIEVQANCRYTVQKKKLMSDFRVFSENFTSSFSGTILISFNTIKSHFFERVLFSIGTGTDTRQTSKTSRLL
ncbi:hypothetical protein BY458DRAFT_491848 [Sporodiniella umbellata]|nr:hypothetical protein BY458DRAFT_491848 [Sporodiniella umbellata]